jgi:hypothetical protein
MSTLPNFDYYNYRKNYVTKKINEEINFFDKNGYTEAITVVEYLIYLKNRISSEKIVSSNTAQPDKNVIKYEDKVINLEEYGKYADELVFKRPWPKLKEYHKIMKINQYINTLKYSESISERKREKNKKYLREEIIQGIKNKKFLKNKSQIEYDTSNMKIISISCLDYNKKTKLYEIVQNQPKIID